MYRPRFADQPAITYVGRIDTSIETEALYPTAGDGGEGGSDGEGGGGNEGGGGGEGGAGGGQGGASTNGEEIPPVGTQR